MSPPPAPRVLITTAGFGDGHNTAARNLARALENRAETLIVDPCEAGAPTLNNLLRSGYRFTTTHLPKVWKHIYRSVERRDFSKQRIPMMRLAERALEDALREFQPSIIASTYPLYPYFLARSFGRGIPRCPVITVVTDSININAAWRKAPTDYWILTDRATREGLIAHGLPERQLIETGFPVDPRFGDLQPLSPEEPARPFRVLFFPTSKKPTVRRIARTILDHHDWPTELTIVLGRNVRKLYRRAREIKDAYPGRVRIKGWSRRVPELLCSHHLVVGKAGGATVHEALAARCPMLIHHLVPGQEEGNLQLLQTIGAGGLAETEESLASSLRDLLSDQAALWRRQKRQLNRHARPQAAISAANFLLSAVPPSKP
jgi:processive 1,2-diacylglycerol beta-glucosyltransferase